MLYHDGGIEEAEGRQHPWTVSTQNPEWKYYDFKQQPELVPQVIEDYKPFDQYEATQRFYEMVTWLNGDGSKFETSDARFPTLRYSLRKTD